MRFIAKITCLISSVLLGTSVAKAFPGTNATDSSAHVAGTHPYQSIPTGELLMGATFSHTQLTNGGSQILPMIEGLQMEGALTSLSPFFGVCISPNHVLGIRFAYQQIQGMANNNEFLQHNYGGALFHRNYLALDSQGRFTLFNESRLAFAYGESQFQVGDLAGTTHTRNRQMSITFHPGLSVSIMKHVSIDVSVGIGGVSLSDSRNYDGEQLIGKRTSLNTHLYINLLDISLGMTIHL